MIFRTRETKIIPLIPKPLHHILMHHSPHKPIIRTLLRLLLLPLARRRNQRTFPPIKSVNRSLHTLLSRRHTVEEETERHFSKPHERIIPLNQRNLHVHKRRILPPSRVRHVLIRRLLLQQILRHHKRIDLDVVDARSAFPAEPYDGKLLVQDGRVGRDPRLGLPPVGAHAPEVHGDDDEDEGQDDGFLEEVARGGALPDLVPARVRRVGAGLRRVEEGG